MRKKYSIFRVIILIILAFTIVLHIPALSVGTCPTTPNLNYYTSYPPFITSATTPPSVMIILDNSGSMFRFAYFDGWNTDSTADDKSCVPSQFPPLLNEYCTEFTAPGTYPTFKYYGYFDPDYWYIYDTSGDKFVPTAPKTGSGLPGARAKTSSEWDGNFLNWVTMRRVDVIRKVLTGGKYVAVGGEKRLITEAPDYYGRGILKSITNAQNYTPYSSTGNAYFYFDYGTSNPSRFWVSEYSDFRTYDYRYVRVVSVAGTEPTGIVQNMWTSVRWGLSFYHINNPTPQGGYVEASVGKISQSSFVNAINNKRPDSNTPLAETLWTNVGYFAQVASWLGGPGPRYQSGDYTINNLNDPYNYGTGGQPLYISCSKSFILYITDGEPCADGYLPSILSDYANGRSPYNCQGNSCPAVGNFPASTFPSCYGGGEGGYVAGIEDVALFAHINDIRTTETKDISGIQTLTIYPIFAFGKGSTLLKYTAINGGFIDSNGNNIPDLQSEWDSDNDGTPDTYYEATEGYGIETALLNALNDIQNRSSAGGASSVLASTGEGEGAVYQGLFVPGQSNSTEARWRGYVQGLFMDKYGNLREDTNGNDALDYTIDKIVVMYYDSVDNTTKVRRYSDSDGDGEPDGTAEIVTLNDIVPIWEGGKILWARDPATRKIYTTIDGYSFSGLNLDTIMGTFYAGNASVLRPYLRASTDAEAIDIINYIRGTDISGYRTRSFTINGVTNTWKLGDIIYASPTLVAAPSENYDLLYADSTYATFRQKYANRRHVLYVGANDGMLHAFNAGIFDTATLSFSGGGYTLGEELWAFIPRDLLPHLKWLTDPNYTHVYYVDLKPKIVDARIFTSELNNPNGTHPYGWGTILIGGMRYGGKEICVTDDFGAGNETKTFRSSYFALDITDPEQPPTLLWTFSHPDLPLTTSYPAVLRVGPRSGAGTWFVIFGSGPTDYDGTSTQTGRIFALKISGTSNGVISSWVAGTNYWKSGVDFLVGGANTTIDNYAFMADPITVDVGTDYKVDVIYIGNTYCDNPISPQDPSKCSSSNWKGKMYRIATRTSIGADPSTNPTDWTLSVLFDPEAAQVINPDIVTGPISAAPAAAMDNKGNLWLFFGLGRFWHTNDKALDCPNNNCESWAFFGIKDICKPWVDPTNSLCASSVTDLYNSTSVDVCGSVSGDPTKQGGEYTTCEPLYGTPQLWSDIIQAASIKNGWYLNFPPPGEEAGERVLSKPLVLGGLVSWTSYTPNSDDPCAFEGTSNLYATYYLTGTAYRKYIFEQAEGAIRRHIDLGVGVPSTVGAAVTGSNTIMGFIQQSTGTIVQIKEVTPQPIQSRLTGWRSKDCQ
jgi:type IV pilus assembly protein PilY1